MTGVAVQQTSVIQICSVAGVASRVMDPQIRVTMKRLVLLLSAVSVLGVLLSACDQNPAAPEPRAVALTEPALPYGKATRHGLFRHRGAGWVQDSAKTSTGKVIRGATLEFLENQNTDRIPLRNGVTFGYRYWLKFPPDQKQVSFKRVLVHPEMNLPDGTKVTRSERKLGKKTTHGIVTSIDAYALSEDYELVEGDWIFQLWYENKMLAEQKFTTYWPHREQAPAAPARPETGNQASGT